MGLEEKIKNDLIKLMSREGLIVQENQELERVYFGYKIEGNTGLPYLSIVLKSESSIFCVYVPETTDVFLAKSVSSHSVEDVLLCDEMEIVKFIVQEEFDKSFSPFSTLFNAPENDPKVKRLLKAS